MKYLEYNYTMKLFVVRDSNLSESPELFFYTRNTFGSSWRHCLDHSGGTTSVLLTVLQCIGQPFTWQIIIWCKMLPVWRLRNPLRVPCRQTVPRISNFIFLFERHHGAREKKASGARDSVKPSAHIFFTGITSR